MNKNFLAVAIMMLCTLFFKSQNITMEFPAFPGKSYELIIFQGSKSVKVLEGVIPSDGKFVLTIPEQYAPYKGMSRWLLTNSKEGGGLDMYIPGTGFSVRCSSATPDENSIKYENFDPVTALNTLSSQQQQIIDKYQLMNEAMKLYHKDPLLYGIFSKERNNQTEDFDRFNRTLKADTTFASKLLPIINITRGIPIHLNNDAKPAARDLANYITHELDMNDLYTSGHWPTVIDAWVQIEADAVNKDSEFLNSFRDLSDAVKDRVKYTDLVTCITTALTRYGKDKYINLIAPYVLRSGKITEYTGILSSYQKSLTGQIGPGLLIRNSAADSKEKSSMKMMSADKFAGQNYAYTLILFYETGCGACTSVIDRLIESYPVLRRKNVRVIAISADTEEDVFREKAKSFPWKDTYCDFEGWKGINFTNYAVSATPTIFLISRNGKILERAAALEDILIKQNN